MNNKTQSYRDKGRALFLAAIMVLSVLAMSATLVAPVAAASNAEDLQFDGEAPPLEIEQGEEVITDVSFSISELNDETADQEVEFEISIDGNAEFTAINSVETAEIDASVSQSAEIVEGAVVFSLQEDASDYATTITLDGATIQADDPNNADVIVDVTDNGGADTTTPFTNAIDIPFFAVDNLDPASAAVNPGEELTISADITNTGAQGTQDIVLEIDDEIDEDVATAQVISETVEDLTLDNGETETVSFTVDAPEDTGDYTHTISSDDESVEGTLTVANDGFIQGNVRDTGNNPIPNAEVIATNVQTGQVFTTFTDGSGDYTVGVPGGFDYEVVVDQDGFESFSTVREVTPGGTETIDVTLQSNIFPEKVGVALWDSEEEEVIGDAAALLADGEFDNQAELVVFTQSQINGSLADEAFDAELTLEDTGGDFAFLGTGDGIFVDDDVDPVNTSESLTLTLDGDSPVADVGAFNVDDFPVIDDATIGDAEFQDGDVSYETFNITAGNASAEDVEDIANAVATGQINASIEETGQDRSTTLNDTADVTYFVEGDRSTQHQVVDTDAEPIENATVWAIYDGAPQDLDDVEEFVNNDGEAFLVDETNEDGIAVIPGLVSSEEANGAFSPEFNVYVVADGFNVFNATEEGLPLSDGEFIADYTLNNAIEESEGSGDAKVFSHVLRETAQDFDLNVTVDDGQKSTSVPSGEQVDIEVEVLSGEVGQDPGEFTPIENQEIDIELTNATGSLIGADDDGVVTVETDANGTAEATFTSGEGIEGTTNVTASTTNVNGDEYVTETDEGQSINSDADQAEITVFGVGELTGDVVDDEDQNVPGADVTLTIRDDGEFVAPDETDLLPDDYDNTRTTGQTGSFAFVNLPTGEDYRVVAEFTSFDGTTFSGFAVENDLDAGSNNADIVIQDLVIDEEENDNNENSEQTAVEFYDEDADGEISNVEVLNAVEDWQNGDGYFAGLDDTEANVAILSVIDAWQESN